MKKIIPGLLVILAMIIILTGCGTAKPPTTATGEDTQAAKPVFIMAGIIDSSEKAMITSKISAKVASVSVDTGSLVNKGDILINLDSKEIEAQVAQAQAGVETAQANLAKMQSGARPEQIAQAQAAADSADANYLNIKNNYERNQKLFAAGAIAQAQLENLQTQLSAAKAQNDTAQNQLAILTKGETKESLNILQAQVKQAQAALELAQAQLANTTLIAPVSGVVGGRNINPGELASPGATLLTVVNTNSLYIKASLPVEFTEQVAAGQKVLIRTAEIPDKELPGEITTVDQVLDSRNRSVLVKVNLENPDSDLKPGMLAEIALDNQKQEAETGEAQ
ncbi:MAG TPA: efflux RND transporter periplasmic adaptor subunit [Desulfitobacteriaceae bacterium]|nr:efflux RND transporter periplasmic adaptor subunit [Desulfitobacteriaceae bacterium]